MKVMICICLAAVVAVTLARPGEKYDTSQYNVNLDEVLGSMRLTQNYVACVLGKGKCTPDGKELKVRIPEALADGCSKCTEEHREGTEKVIKKLINDYPDLWKLLTAKFDPQNIYAAKYEKELKKVQQ